MESRLTAIGMQAAGLDGGRLRGLAFHRARLERAPHACLHAASPHGRGAAEAIFRDCVLTVSRMDWDFASNPAAGARLFRG